MSTEEQPRYTDRGFRIYTEFTDRYDHEVRVQQSSLATEDCVWIFGDGAPEVRSPHLTVDMAVKVRDALDTWIKEVTG